MMNLPRPVSSLLLHVAFGLVIFGCGTTHHFLPPQPLEKGQWQIQTYWHYDLSPGHAVKLFIIPDINAYVGVGKRYNFGFGASANLLPTHITLSHASKGDPDAFLTKYLSFSTAISGNINPMWEAGLAYPITKQCFYHNFTVALSCGQFPAWQDKSMFGGLGMQTRSVIPIVKYTGQGRDAAVSWVHYHGNTAVIMRSFKDDIVNHNDTIAKYPAGSIVRIRSQGMFHSDLYVLELLDGINDTIWESGRGSCIVMPVFLRNDQLRLWLGAQYKQAWFHGTTLIIDMEELKAMVADNKEIVITRFPQALLDKVRKLSSWLNDNSFAIGILANSKQSSEKRHEVWISWSKTPAPKGPSGSRGFDISFFAPCQRTLASGLFLCLSHFDLRSVRQAAQSIHDTDVLGILRF